MQNMGSFRKSEERRVEYMVRPFVEKKKSDRGFVWWFVVSVSVLGSAIVLFLVSRGI
jgi:hypothetical protein